MPAAPTLVTERLTLSGHVPDDLDECAAMWSEPAVYAMIGGQPRSREEVWIRLLRSAGQWAVFGYGAWVLRETTTGRFVGEIGLMETRRAIEPALDDPEMGWTLASWAHGRGFAGEALLAILRWADGKGIARTACIIAPENAPSIRLAKRVGYALLHEARYRDQPTLLFARDAGAAMP